VRLLHQALSSGWERAGSTGVGADHIDHQIIVQGSTQRPFVPDVCSRLCSVEDLSE
jgi:hypothetical protein